MSLATQLGLGCDVSEARPLISENDLAEDFVRFGSFEGMREYW